MKLNEKQLKAILGEQRKTNDILIELSKLGIQCEGRAWREFVRQYNDEFEKHDRYIASDSHGYYLTVNKKKIYKTAMNKLRCGVSMIKNARKDLQELSKKDQLKLDPEDADIYDLAMRL